MERTVARNVDDRTAFAHRQLCADGRAVAKAHGPQAAARQKTAGFYMADVLRGPHLVLADVRHVKRVRPGQLAHFADELMRADAVLIILGTVILRLPCLDLRHPLRVLRIFDQRQKSLQYLLDVADKAVIHFDVFVDLAGIDIDLQDRRVLRKFFRIQRHTVGKAGTDGQHKISLVHRTVGGAAAVHSQQAQVQRVSVAQYAGCHHRISCGDLRLFGQRIKLLARL